MAAGTSCAQQRRTRQYLTRQRSRACTILLRLCQVPIFQSSLRFILLLPLNATNEKPPNFNILDVTGLFVSLNAFHFRQFGGVIVPEQLLEISETRIMGVPCGCPAVERRLPLLQVDSRPVLIRCKSYNIAPGHVLFSAFGNRTPLT